MSRLPYSLNLRLPTQPTDDGKGDGAHSSLTGRENGAGAAARQPLSPQQPGKEKRIIGGVVLGSTAVAAKAPLRRPSQEATVVITQQQERLHRATSEQLTEIQKRLEEMHLDLKKLESAGAAAAGPGGSGGAPPVAGGGGDRGMCAPGFVSGGPVGGAIIGRSSCAKAGRVHHLSPMNTDLPQPPHSIIQNSNQADGSVLVRVPAPPSPGQHRESPLPPPLPASVVKKATVAPASAVIFEHVGILESPISFKSDDDSDADGSDSSSEDFNIPVVGMTKGRKKASTPPPPPQPAATSADTTANMNSMWKSQRGRQEAQRSGARQGVGFRKKETATATTPAKTAATDASSGTAVKARRGIQLAGDGILETDRGSLRSSSLSLGGRSKSVHLEDGVETPRSHAVDGQDQATRRQGHEALSKRKEFFRSIPTLRDVIDPSQLHNPQFIDEVFGSCPPCSWLCCAALVISYVTGVPTSMEKILRTNHVGVHYIGLSSITLSEFFDLVNDYIHIRFHPEDCVDDELNEDEDAAKYLSPEQLNRLKHVHCEMATFNSAVFDPVDEVDPRHSGMGEHLPITSLADFRKELVDHINNQDSLYVFNFDPYMIERSEAHLRSNMAETEEEAAAIMDSMLYSPKSKGVFGILLDFNPVLHSVTILIPRLSASDHGLEFKPRVPEKPLIADSVPTSRGSSLSLRELMQLVMPNGVFEEHTISMQVLYNATVLTDWYSKMARGFVRVFISEDFSQKVPSVFPLFVLDGSSSGGLMTNALYLSVAAHVLGLAMMHHLTVTFLMSDNARRKQSSRNLLSKANVCDVKLRGIPLTKVCQQLRLPLSTIVGESTRASLPTAFVWYHILLQQLQVSKEVRLGLVLPERRGDADDGMPNISDEEFISHLCLATETQSVMLISFNLNIALNVRVSESAEPAHFAIVIGVDKDRGIVRLADVSVRRFRKTWHIPVNRLYEAVMGYGYMMAAKEKKTIAELNGKEYREKVLNLAKYFLPPATNVRGRLEYPLRSYPVTVLADAVDRLGFPADLERFLNFSGFHISYFLSRHMPLEAAAFVTQNYSHYALDDVLSVQVTHYEYSAERLPPNEVDPLHPVNPKHALQTEETLLAAIEEALAHPKEQILIVKYDQYVVMADSTVWNGSMDGGSYAMVVEYDKQNRVVMLMDCNPSLFHRIFACPLSLLLRALCSRDTESMRANGTLLLSARPQDIFHENSKGYDMAHSLVHHPFKPNFSPTCACLALAATEMMQHIDAPMLLGGAPLAVDGKDGNCGARRKYKRYNNIFSAEEFLYAFPSFSVHDIQETDLLSGGSSRVALAFKTLKLPLTMQIVASGDAEGLCDISAFLKACDGIPGVLTVSGFVYDTDKIHGVPGTSAGIVNCVEADEDGASGSVQIIEGDPCRWGAYVERRAEEWVGAVKMIFCICENEENEA